MAQFWESKENITSELDTFSAGTGDDEAFVVRGENENFRWGFKLTAYTEVAALMNACRLHLCKAVALGPVDWQPHPEFADMEIADVRGYRIVVGPDSYTIYQEEKIVATGSSERPKRYSLEALERHRPVAVDCWTVDGWEDVTKVRLDGMPIDCAARWLARNPRHRLAEGLARVLEKVGQRTSPANAIAITQALEHRKALVLVLAEDVPASS